LSRKERDRSGLFLVEGLQLVEEAAETGADIVELILAPELLHTQSSGTIASILARTDIPSLEVTPEVLKSISPKHGQQGVAAVARQRWERMEDIRLSDGTCWVALDRIQLPGSLGTIIRVCDAVGAAGVVLVGDSTDPYDPASVRASLGAVFSQRLVKASFEEFAAWKKQHSAFVVGASPGADTDYQAIPYPPAMVLFMGSERIGLPPEHESVCDVMVRIPMVGRCESHHVAVATAVVLYEIFSQRRAAKGETVR
jgi:TrmH family RNA methyltransferase